MNRDEFSFLILSIVSEIPEGKVASYKQIAQLSGFEKQSRRVGQVLSNANFYGKYPCHRVLYSNGKLAASFATQRERLEAEGIIIEKDKVDMKRYRWCVD